MRNHYDPDFEASEIKRREERVFGLGGVPAQREASMQLSAKIEQAETVRTQGDHVTRPAHYGGEANPFEGWDQRSAEGAVLSAAVRRAGAKEAVTTPFKKAGKLAAQVGFRWHVGDWPGYVRGKGHAADDADDLCHEIGHYLVSPKWLRNRKYFGLGHPLGDSKLVSVGYAYTLEEQASILGIVLARECGQSLADAQDTASEHSWRGGQADSGWQGPVARLSVKGLWSDKRQQTWWDIVS